MTTEEKNQELIFNLTVKVAVLENLMEKTMEALGKAAVAEKTADKALAMAQEALVIVMNNEPKQQIQQIAGDPMTDTDYFNRTTSPTINPRPKLPTDADLSKAMTEAEDDIN